MKKDDIFYGLEDCETLHHIEQDDVVEEYISDCGYDLPELLEVMKYKRVNVTHSDDELSRNCLDNILECLHETYGNPEEPYEGSVDMNVAAREFVNRILDLYVPWQCEVVSSQTIDLKKYVREGE